MDASAYAAERFAAVLEGTPAALTYGGETLAPDFSPAAEAGREDGCTVFTREAVTPDGACRVTLTIRLFEAAAEWYLTLTNTSAADSARFTDLRYCDLTIPCPKYDGTLYPRVMWSRGSNADDDDFMFESRRMHMSPVLRMGSHSGRASDTRPGEHGFMPYVCVAAAPDRGVILASGFSGSWEGEIARRNENGAPAVHARFTFPGADFVLRPGESVRLPAALMLPWYLPGEGTGADGAFVLWRRFIRAHMFPRVGGKPAEAPVCIRGCGGFHMPRHRARLDNAVKHGFGKYADLYGIDAGWYQDEDGFGDWFNTAGDWDVSPAAYPNGNRELSGACREAGLGFSMWMEFERVGVRSKMYAEPTVPLLRGAKQALLDLGDGRARTYITEQISALIAETGMTCFRTDFNVPPAEVFAANDAEDRRGLTELRYYFGLYEVLDGLLARFPDLVIDNCASGGRRLDYELCKRAFPVMCRSDYFCCQTDFGDATMQNMTLCLSRWLPVFSDSLGTCAQCGRTHNVGDTYHLRSAIACGVCVACPDFDMTEDEAAWYRKMLSEARRVRPFMSRDVWPLTGPSFSDKDLCAWQAHDPDTDSGVILVFRRAECPVTDVTLTLRGLTAGKTYVCEDTDGLPAAAIADGRLPLALPAARTARIIFYR